MIEKKESVSKQNKSIRQAYRYLDEYESFKNSQDLFDSFIQIFKENIGFVLYLIKACSKEKYLEIIALIENAFFEKKDILKFVFRTGKKTHILRCKKCKYEKDFYIYLFFEILEKKLKDLNNLFEENIKKTKVSDFLFWLFLLHQEVGLELDICLALLSENTIRLKNKDYLLKIGNWFNHQKYPCPNSNCKANRPTFEGNNWELVDISEENQAEASKLIEENVFLKKILG